MLVFETENQRTYRRVAKPSSKDACDTLQELVKGNIELLPHRNGWEARFTAYANEEGMLDDLPSNFLAWGVLRHLGFEDSTAGLCFYFGNVVLMGRNERALSGADMKLIDAALAAYKEEMGGDEEEKDAPEYDTAPKTKKRRIMVEDKDA